jgi:chromosome segregation ATPase
MKKIPAAAQIVAGALLLAGCLTGAAAGTSAQSRDESVPVLRELVAEVRGLRAAIERYADGQAQIQTLTSVLTLQQSRLAELNARLDATRRELEQHAVRAGQLSTHLEQMESGRMATESRFQGTPAQKREQFDAALADVRAEQERALLQEQQIRSREMELQNALNAEQARWNDLQERLDLLLRR